MFKVNFKIFFLPLVMLFLVLCSINAQANVPDYLTIVGPDAISVGKTNVQYSLDYFFSGRFLSCSIWVSILGGYDIASNMFHETETFVHFDAPTNECALCIEAELLYERDSFNQHYVRLFATKTIYVCKPDLQTIRLGLEGVNYNISDTIVPIHWNIDDDDTNGYGSAVNTKCGEDYRQYEQMICNDDDLYSIQAHIGNTALDTANCNLKIKTSDSLRLWYSQNKGELCCDADSVFETNCNIRTWFNNKANSTGNRLYVEWIGDLPMATNAYVEFYCNNIQFAKLPYKGYALCSSTYINRPITSERIFFETRCELDGCEWGINALGSGHVHDRNSLSEAVDGEYWTRYGEPFVVTTSSPLCSNIYTLQNSLYNTFNCRCISMDTFGDRSHTFEDSDATAFFTISYFWLYNYVNYNTSPDLSDIIYYSGQFAATRVASYWLVGCHPSWTMFTSRFFYRPKIVHRPNQLESTRTINKTYMKELP